MNTVDVEGVKQILNNCPNYDYIINYNSFHDDILSSKLIDWYKELIFSVSYKDENQLSLIKAIDRSIYLYVKDNRYKREINKILDIKDISFDNSKTIKELIKKLINFTQDYEKKIIFEVNNTKWL